MKTIEKQIPTAEVEPAESLFVTFCDRFGHFYGQFDKRATAEFKGLDLELFAFYGGSGDKPLLYADVKDHIGDYGILKWAEDNKLYRVEVMDEFAGNEVKTTNQNQCRSPLDFFIFFLARYW